MAGYLVFVVFMTVFSEARGEDLAAPTLSVKPEIITKSGSVTLHCQTPVPVTLCLYSFNKGPFKTLPCHQTINGTKLLSLLNINFPSEINVACFYLNATTSPPSEKKVISVRDPGPPTVSVHPSVITEFSSVTLYCQPPTYVSVSGCSFYTLSGLTWAGSSCTRTLSGSDLLKNKQSAPAEVQVKCYYTEQNEETSPSPHSEKTILAVKVLAAPTLTVEPSVITEMDRVILHCQPPSYVSASLCYFYTVSASGGKTLDATDCVQNITGSDLFLVNARPPIEVKIQCYYTVNQTPSPQSDERTIMVNVLAPPTLTVEPSVITEMDRVILHCQPPSYVSASLCFFYTVRDSGEKPLNATDCVQNLTGSDLFSVTESPPIKVEIQCYYIVNQKTSPHSDKRTITTIMVTVLAPPTLTVEPSVITEMDRVILHCQPPSYVSASLCYFYTVSASGGKTLDATDCVQNLTGSDLFSVTESPPIKVEIQCYYIVNQKTSPHSDKRTITTIMVTATKITSTTSPPSTSTLFNPETSTGTQAHVTRSETVTAPDSGNSTATKSLIKTVILLTAGGVTVGCVLLVVTFFCTKQRNDKVKSQAPNSGGQPGACKYSLCSPEPAADSQGETVTEMQPDVRQQGKVTETDPYHEYASIPDTPYSVSVKNVMYSSLEMTEQ